MAERVLTLRVDVQGNYNQAFSQFNNALRTSAQQQEQVTGRLHALNNSLNTLNQTLGFVGVSFSMVRVLNFASDMNQLGSEVNKAEQVFNQLASQIGDSNDVLQAMRDKTLGVVDDLTLMHGANRLLQMGLADTTQEVSGLTAMAIQLGSALGMDANKAIEDFSLLLSNMSYLRLDQFGIAAGAVRTRVKELAAEFPGMAREARFAQAVLEEGQSALEDLGTAAGAGSRAIERLSTRASNQFQEWAGNLNYATDAIARFIEVTLFELPQARAEAVVEASYAFADLSEQIINGLLGEGIQQGASASFVSQFVINAIQMAESDPGLWTDLDTFRNRIIGQLRLQGVELPENVIMGEMDTTMEMWLTYISQQQQYIAQSREAAEIEQRRITALQNLSGMGVAFQENISGFFDLVSTSADNAIDRLTEMEQLNVLRRGALGGLHTQMMEASAGLFRQTGFEGEEFRPTQQFATDEDVYRLEQSAHWAERQIEYMRELEDSMGNAVFTDEQIQEAELYADQIRGMADESRRMADALKDASLSELFGETSGGRVGEMSDMVIENMRASGRSEEEIAAAENIFGAASGRRTAATANMENLVPMLANMDPATAALAMQNLDEVLTTLAGAGFDINNLTPEQFLNAAGMVQLGSGSPNITIVTSGDTLSQLAMEGGTTLSDLLRNNPQITNPNLIHPGDEIAMGPSTPGAEMIAGFDPSVAADAILDMANATPIIATDFEAMTASSELFTGNIEQAKSLLGQGATAVTDITTQMVNLTSQEFAMRLRFIVDASSIRLAVNDALGQFNLSRGVGDHGGSVPGTEGGRNR